MQTVVMRFQQRNYWWKLNTQSGLTYQVRTLTNLQTRSLSSIKVGINLISIPQETKQVGMITGAYLRQLPFFTQECMLLPPSLCSKNIKASLVQLQKEQISQGQQVSESADYLGILRQPLAYKLNYNRERMWKTNMRSKFCDWLAEIIKLSTPVSPLMSYKQRGY